MNERKEEEGGREEGGRRENILGHLRRRAIVSEAVAQLNRLFCIFHVLRVLIRGVFWM